MRRNALSAPVAWRDMAVLLRAPANKAEAYAKEFERAGVPLVVERGGFYDSTEIADLLSLLTLLDNPLQDVPVIAVLRSPLVGLSLDELATVRLAAKDVHFWTALNRARKCGARSAEVNCGRKSTNFSNDSRAGGNWRGRRRCHNAWNACWRKRITPSGCVRVRAARNGRRTLNGSSASRSSSINFSGRACFAF